MTGTPALRYTLNDMKRFSKVSKMGFGRGAKRPAILEPYDIRLPTEHVFRSKRYLIAKEVLPGKIEKAVGRFKKNTLPGLLSNERENTRALVTKEKDAEVHEGFKKGYSKGSAAALAAMNEQGVPVPVPEDKGGKA